MKYVIVDKWEDRYVGRNYHTRAEAVVGVHYLNANVGWTRYCVEKAGG